MKINSAKLKKITDFFKEEFPTKSGGEIKIFFENNFEDWLCLMTGKFLTAKGIQERTGGKVWAINQKKDAQYEKLCKSFGYETCFLDEGVKWWERICAYIYALVFCLFKNNGNNILEIRYKGVHIGDLIYDYMIRVSQGAIYTIKRIRSREQFKLLAEGFLYAIYYNRYFKCNKPDYFVAGDIIYLNGIIVRTAMKYKARIIEFCTGKYIYEIKYENIRDYEPNYHLCCADRIREYENTRLESDWKLDADKKIESLFAGQGDWNTQEAYLNKKIVSKKEILKDLKINNKKKNIVILAHCFSDSPHRGGGFIYNDYFCWLEETLKIIKDLDNVNWIIKGHPCRRHYGEAGVVEKMLRDNKSENLYWMPDEYSSKMIPVFADAIITVEGTGGIEYSCCGVPCVNVGHPFYSYFGFTINIKSQKQYKNVLKMMHRIHPLCEAQINDAKKVLHIYTKITDFSQDSLQQLFNGIYYDYRKRNDTYKNNNDMVDVLIDWKRDNRIKDSEIYKKGYNFGEK